MIYGLVLELRFKGSDYVAGYSDICKFDPMLNLGEPHYYFPFTVRKHGKDIIDLPKVTDLLHACYYIVNQVYFYHYQLKFEEVSILDHGLRSLIFHLKDTFLEINSLIEKKIT